MTTEPETPNGKPTITDGEIIERFGGIRPMASKLGVAVTTVQGWKERGHIPEGRLSQIIAAAATHGVDIGIAPPPVSEPVTAPVSVPVTPPTPEPVTAPELKPAAPVVQPEPPEPEQPPEPEPVADPVEEAAPAAPQPAIAPSPASGVSPLTLVVVVVLLGGVILTGPLWQSKLYPRTGTGPVAVDTGRLDDIADGLARLETAMENLKRDLDTGDGNLSGRIDALEAGGGETGAAFAEQLAAIENNLDALDKGLSGIETRLAALEATRDALPDRVKTSLDATDSALGALTKTVGDQGQAMRDGMESLGVSVAGLADRIAALETRPVQTGEKIAAMVLALGHVESGLNSGQPYRPALNRLETLGREDPLISGGAAIEALATWADHGIPDRLALRRRFAELAPEIDRAMAGQEERNWLDSVWNSVTGLITIRKIDGADLTPIGQAEQALERGDLAAAAAAFVGQGPVGPQGQAWLDQVKARVATEAEINSLYGQMISPLVGDGGDEGAATQ